MGAGEVLIGGTAYEIKGGKTLIGGTAYDIKAGKTLIGGTAYNISFAPPKPMTIEALFADFVLDASAGRNSSTTDSVSIKSSDLDTGTFYLFSFCNGYMGIYRIAKSDQEAFSITRINRMSGSYGNAFCVNAIGSARLYYSSDESALTKVRACTLIVGHFPNYTNAEVESILTGATYTRGAGRNSSSTANVGGNGTFTNPATLFVATNNLMAFSTVAYNEDDMVYYSNCADNPSMATAPGKWGDGYTIYLSLVANKARASVYGASMIEVS